MKNHKQRWLMWWYQEQGLSVILHVLLKYRHVFWNIKFWSTNDGVSFEFATLSSYRNNKIIEIYEKCSIMKQLRNTWEGRILWVHHYHPILFFVSLIQILFDVTVKMLKVFLTWFGQGLKENMFLESGMNRFKVNFLQCIYTQFVKSICHEMKSCAQICSRQKRSVSLVVHLNM